MQTNTSTRYVISVMVGDRVGILRDITSAVTDMGANIDGISQTVVEGYFTVILTATFSSPCAAEDVCSAIRANFAAGEASITAQPYTTHTATQQPVSGQGYIFTISGIDKPGILKRVTAFLASKGINAEDWYVHFDGDRVTHIGEITVPSIMDIKQVQDEFSQALKELDLNGFIQHRNIFRVTNEVGAVQGLLRGESHA